MHLNEPTARPSRRRVIGAAAAAGTAAWVAPAVVSVDAVAAQSSQPGGSLLGTVTTCGHELDPGDSFLVTATQVPGGASGSTTTSPTGSYAIAGLPAGTYDVTISPNGDNVGRPDETFPGAAVVTDGASTFFDPDYQANGC